MSTFFWKKFRIFCAVWHPMEIQEYIEKWKIYKSYNKLARPSVRWCVSNSIGAIYGSNDKQQIDHRCSNDKWSHKSIHSEGCRWSEQVVDSLTEDEWISDQKTFAHERNNLNEIISDLICFFLWRVLAKLFLFVKRKKIIWWILGRTSRSRQDKSVFGKNTVSKRKSNRSGK